MTGSGASRSADAPARALLVAPSWIGDGLMAWPAAAAWRRAHPGAPLAVLAKPAVAPLWRRCPSVSEVLPLAPGLGGLARAGRAIRAGRFERAWILPHSVRSALAPFLGRVPERWGFPGHGGRDLLLTRVVRAEARAGREHQAWEAAALITADGELTAEELRPRLVPPPAALAEAQRLLAAAPRPVIGLAPGAARGSSKRWPAAHFAALGRILAAERGATILVLGGPADAAAAQIVADSAGPAARNLAGRTPFDLWVALLSRCDVVVANDSGGMHLAAAAGAAVVALYGATDPARTGPLSDRVRILREPGAAARDIARQDAAAAARLSAISPDRAAAAVADLLAAAGARA